MRGFIFIGLILSFSGCICCGDSLDGLSSIGSSGLLSGESGVSISETPLMSVSDATKESQTVVNSAADALEKGDGEALKRTVCAGCLASFDTGFDASSDGAKKLGAALRQSKVSKAEATIIYYSGSSDGEPFEFYTVKEAGAWKLSMF